MAAGTATAEAHQYSRGSLNVRLTWSKHALLLPINNNVFWYPISAGKSTLDGGGRHRELGLSTAFGPAGK